MTIVGLSAVSGRSFEYVGDPNVSLGVAPLLVVVALAGLSRMRTPRSCQTPATPSLRGTLVR